MTYRGENKVTHISLKAPNPCTFADLASRSRAKFHSLRESNCQLRFKFSTVQPASSPRMHGQEEDPAIVEVDDQAGMALIDPNCLTYQVTVISFGSQPSQPGKELPEAMPFDRGYLTDRSQQRTSSLLTKTSIVKEDTNLSQVR